MSVRICFVYTLGRHKMLLITEFYYKTHGCKLWNDLWILAKMISTRAERRMWELYHAKMGRAFGYRVACFISITKLFFILFTTKNYQYILYQIWILLLIFLLFICWRSSTGKVKIVFIFFFFNYSMKSGQLSVCSW